MCSLWTCNFLLFLLVYTYSANSQVHYYITPSQKLGAHCLHDPCITLAKLAANPTSYLGNETNISLYFLQGNHSLDRELTLSQADSFSMIKDLNADGTVFVECDSQSGRFSINETMLVTIEGLHFIGCGGNKVSRVKRFMIHDTIFEGVKNGGTALVLDEVALARIATSSFLSNSHGGTFKDYPLQSSYHIVNHIFWNEIHHLQLVVHCLQPSAMLLLSTAISCITVLI